MKNLLCRHCFKLFRDDRIGVVCRSERCARVVDDRGEVRARYMDPRAMGLWRRFQRRLQLDTPCPHCQQVDTLVPACPRCRGQLDHGVGDVEDRVVGVIGASLSGKSHYLATVLYKFLEDDVGGSHWEVSMTREDLALYRRDFLRRLFEDQEELAGTPARLGPELRLLLKNRASGQQTLLVFRDLGGELFADPESLQKLSFLRYAQGIVLMADPLAYEPPVGNAWTPNDAPTAARVLHNYRRVLLEQERYPEHRDLPLLPQQKVLAVAVTKADLVLPDDHPFWSNGEPPAHLEPGYWQRRADENTTARKWVRENLDRTLAEIADEFADVGYFFVSSFGYPHEPHSELPGPPRPRRVHEPIFALLDRLATLQPAAKEDDDAGL